MGAELYLLRLRIFYFECCKEVSKLLIISSRKFRRPIQFKSYKLTSKLSQLIPSATSIYDISSPLIVAFKND